MLAHLLLGHGYDDAEAGSDIVDTYLVLPGGSIDIAEASCRPVEGPGKPVSLHALVILYMFRKLAEGIRARRTLGAAEEGHIVDWRGGVCNRSRAERL